MTAPDDATFIAMRLSMRPPDAEHGQNPRTFEQLCAASQVADAARQMSGHPCACGCRASVKPGQRWSQPACKARAYRARQRAARDQERQEFWDGVEKYVQLEEDYDGLEEAYDRLKADYARLEEAFHAFREQHRQCRRLPPAEAAPRPWFGDAYAVLGVRPDAELEAIEGAYRALVQKYHHDRHPGDPVMEARMKALTAAYAEIMRVRGVRPKR